MQINPNAVWRDSGRVTKVGPLNSRAVIPLVLWLLHMRWWTFFSVIIVISFLIILDYYNLSPVAVLRLLRSKLAGPHIRVRFWWS